MGHRHRGQRHEHRREGRDADMLQRSLQQLLRFLTHTGLTRFI
jgi:hypothetical protein